MSKKIRDQIADVKQDLYKNQMAGFRIIGEVISWDAKKAGSPDVVHTRASFIEALKYADLKEEMAKELKPRYAFSRAKQKLMEDRIIRVLREETDSITFQFNKGIMENKEWKYPKETLLKLNLITGRITCDIPNLEVLAQKELDRAMEERTTSDITKLVQKMFEEQEDLNIQEEKGLFPFRKNGGTYVVFAPLIPFLEKVQSFLEKLGGRLNRIPIPAGTQVGDKTVTDVVASKFHDLIEDLNAKTAGFSINTRADTMEHAAEQIKATRIKIEAYADHLQDKSKELMEALANSNQQLLDQINGINKTRSEAPPTTNGETREKLFGYAVTSVIRWMGKNQWDFDTSLKALENHSISVAHSTIRAQLLAGRKGDRGEPANLSEEQIKQLEA